MKRIRHILLVLSVILTVAAADKLAVHAYTEPDFKQTSCTENSVTFTWNNQNEKSGSYQEVVEKYVITTQDGLYYTSVDGYTTTATLDLPFNYIGNVFLKWSYYTTTGNGKYKGPYSRTTSTEANTLPISITSRDSFGIYSVSGKKVNFYCKFPEDSSNINGALLQVYSGSSRIGSYTLGESGRSQYISVKNNVVYRYRVKYSYKKDDNTYYSAKWSPFRYFMYPAVTVKLPSKGLSVTVKKVTGVTQYNVYISQTSAKTGFKKVKTIKLGKKKSTTVKITSGYKKKKVNYVKVIPVINGYGNSEIYTSYKTVIR